MIINFIIGLGISFFILGLIFFIYRLAFGKRRKMKSILKNISKKEEIIIECRQEKGKAVIRIRDDGEGIAPELLPHIFDRFFSTRKGGAGVGAVVEPAVGKSHVATRINW